VHNGAEIRDFDDRAGSLLRQDEPTFGRATRFALAATRLGLWDARLNENALNPERTGVVMGTTSGEPHEVERFNDFLLAGNLSSLGPEFPTRYACHRIPERIASSLGIYGGGGPLMLPVACAAGNCAISHAVDVLRCGEADVMLAGGTDAFSRITFTGFSSLFAVAPDRCQPFARDRKGMIPGEGSAVLVLERKSHAMARGARIYAEVAGCGIACDATHMTGGDPEGRGLARAMEKAMDEAGLETSDIDYISAHGTGTKSNDCLETLAVKRVFERRAADVPMSSIKSMLGHAMGAAAAIEAAVCVLAIERGVVPGTMNLDEADPDCDLDYVPNEARELPVHVAMNNASGFGGTHASIILKRFAS
jgi:3-oxoacyl-[acyl-carrier-protein] synthase II